MNETIYTITLSDGTKLNNLTLCGNNFVSEQEITQDIFAGKLKHVTIVANVDDAIMTGEFDNMELVQIAKYGDKWFFILSTIDPERLANMQTRADIEYVAMMAGVEL